MDFSNIHLGHRDPRRGLAMSIASALAVAMAVTGCQRNQSTGPLATTGPRSSDSATSTNQGLGDAARPKLKPNELISRMIDAYHKAKSYADAGQLRITIEREGKGAEDSPPQGASVSFVRPNKVRVQCDTPQTRALDLMLVCDGKKLRASVGSLDKQVLELDAPPKFAIGNLYLGDAFYETLAQTVGGVPIQLALLLDSNSIAAILPEGGIVSALEPRDFDGHACQRVKIELPDGPRVYWIDEQSYVLRLVEFPTEGLRQQIEAREGPVKRVAMVLELLGARLDQPVPDTAFQFEVPSDGKVVKQLLNPPHPVSELLGTTIPDFNFIGINAGPTNKRSAIGKITVLDFWFTGCGPCREEFPMLAKVYEKYKTSDRVNFVGVSVDEPGMDDKVIQETAAAWGASFPIARDTSGQFKSAFQSEATPALFVLGPDGKVQYSEVGLNPGITKDLSDVIEVLLAGKSTWEEAKSRDRQRQEEYARRTQEPPPPFTAVEDLPTTKILPRDEPKTLKLASAWQTTEIKRPGNFLIVDPAAPEPKVFVLDGPKTVVELSHDGKISARHELNVPEDAVITYLRAAVDKDGHRYFAGSSPGQQHLFVFDADWKLLLTYPAADQGKHAGIGDVQFIDQQQTGTPQVAVGYWGVVGVQAVSLDGTRPWADRTTEFIISMTETSADSKGQRMLLCTNGRGQIVPINSKGVPQGESSAPGVMFETLLSADFGNPQKSICATARNAEGTPLAIGLGPRGEEQWRYVLPRGIFRTPISPLTTAAVAGNGPHWLIAGPDGSIHFIAADGTPLDHFHYGEVLTGLAGVRFGDERLLLVSTVKGVTAWRVQ